MKDQIKKAFDLAENEVEEKQIEYLKNIIKSLLQKKKDKEKERDELDEDIKLIKQDIDDFKAGRLDKIKERHEVNERADRVAPIQITIINDNSRVTYPTQPWRWNYELCWASPQSALGSISSLSFVNGTGGNTFYATGQANALNTMVLCGNTATTYTSGTYQVNGNIINL